MAYKFVDFSNAGFEASRGLAVVALAYIGGIATVGGAFVAGILAPAGILFTVIGANSTDAQLLFSGFGLIIVAIKFPGGIASARDPLRRAMQRAKASAERQAGVAVKVPAAGDIELWMEPERRSDGRAPAPRPDPVLVRRSRPA